MKLKHNKTWFLMAFTLICSLVLIAPFGNASKTSVFAEDSLNFELNGTIEQEYVLNDTLVIPEGNFVSGTKRYEAESIIYYPSEDAYNYNTAILDQTGKYKIEYRAIIDDKLVKEYRYFTVLESLYSVGSPRSRMQYGKPTDLGVSFATESSPKGLSVSLANGDKFTYNGVIDLNNSSRENKAFQFYVTPERDKAADVFDVFVQFTDIYDPNNYAIVSLYSYNSKAYSSNATRACYVTACVPSIGQAYTGHYTTHQLSENGYRDIVFKSMRTSGFCSFMSLYGNNGNGNIYWEGDGKPAVGLEKTFVVDEGGYLGQHQFDLWWNYGQKQVLSSQPLNFKPGQNQDYCDVIADFDSSSYYTSLWDGFKTGECYVSMWAESYNNTSFNFVVTQVDGVDLTTTEPKTTYEDTAKPVISVNYNQYNETTYPNAKVGCAYPVFEASAMDGYDGETKVKSRVFYGYKTEKQYELTCLDSFIPDRVGDFTLVYTATDRAGNVATKEVVINATTTANELHFEVDTLNAVKSASISEFITLPKVNYYGGVGTLTFNAIATNKATGVEYVAENMKFRPMQAGTYQVVCSVSDFIGQTEKVTYDVEISDNKGAIFESIPNVLEYFIVGHNYRLPQLQAKLGNNFVDAKIYVEDNGNRTLIDGGLYYVDGESRNVKIIYSAGAENNLTELVFDASVVKVTSGKRNNISSSLYFVGDGFTMAGSSSDVTLTANEGVTTVKSNYINAILAEGFSADFKISAGNFEELAIYLTDSENKNESIKLSWKNLSGTNFMFVNNKISTVSTLLDFSGANSSNFVWNNLNRTFEDITTSSSCQINKTRFGKDFNGFTSGKIYVTFEMVGINGASSLTFTDLNGQILKDGARSDGGMPQIDFMGGSYPARATVGQNIKMPNYVVADVISPEVNVVITVTAPSGAKVDYSQGKIAITETGEYVVVYSVSDGTNTFERTFRIVASLENQIEITLNGTIPTIVSAGQMITLPSATFNAVGGKINGSILYINPHGVITDVTSSSSFIANYTGTYIVVYYAKDSDGNTRTVTYKIQAV